MGYDVGLVRVCLEEHSWNVQHSAEWLLDHAKTIRDKKKNKGIFFKKIKIKFFFF
jgi:hypothetical protein